MKIEGVDNLLLNGESKDKALSLSEFDFSGILSSVDEAGNSLVSFESLSSTFTPEWMMNQLGLGALANMDLSNGGLESLQSGLLGQLQSSLIASAIGNDAQGASDSGKQQLKSGSDKPSESGKELPSPMQVNTDEGGISWLDGLDIINPMQHIPIASDVYRNVADDSIEYGSKLVGGYLYGGPIGLTAAGLDIAYEQITGEDISQSLISVAKYTLEGLNLNQAASWFSQDEQPQSLVSTASEAWQEYRRWNQND